MPNTPSPPKNTEINATVHSFSLTIREDIDPNFLKYYSFITLGSIINYENKAVLTCPTQGQVFPLKNK